MNYWLIIQTPPTVFTQPNPAALEPLSLTDVKLDQSQFMEVKLYIEYDIKME